VERNINRKILLVVVKMHLIDCMTWVEGLPVGRLLLFMLDRRVEANSNAVMLC
jgi:hypothetical protein